MIAFILTDLTKKSKVRWRGYLGENITLCYTACKLTNNCVITLQKRDKTRFEHHRMKPELIRLYRRIFSNETELTYAWEFMPRLEVLVSYQFIDDDHCGVTSLFMVVA